MKNPTPHRALPVAAHTPTPYFVGENANGFVGLSIQFADGRIAHICHDHDIDDEARATAAFIVRACNSHAALVEALEQALVAGELIAAHFDPGPIPAHEPTQADLDFGNWEYVRQQARAALALAKEGML